MCNQSIIPYCKEQIDNLLKQILQLELQINWLISANKSCVAYFKGKPQPCERNSRGIPDCAICWKIAAKKAVENDS